MDESAVAAPAEPPRVGVWVHDSMMVSEPARRRRVLDLDLDLVSVAEVREHLRASWPACPRPR
jgi:hypothetical protein